MNCEDVEKITIEIKKFLFFKNGGKCCKCGTPLKFKENDTFLVICPLSLCKNKFSLLSNTILSNFKKGVKTFINLVFLVFENVKLKTISKLLKFNPKSLNKFIRKLHIKAKLYKENIEVKLGGEGVIVEIDESKFGKSKFNRGHKVDGVWVFGLVERTNSRSIIFVPVDKRDRTTLKDIVLKFVRPGSVVYSDCWKGYVDLKGFYEHRTVNHTDFYVDLVTGVHTNTIEGNWSYLLKIYVLDGGRSVKFICH